MIRRARSLRPRQSLATATRGRRERARVVGVGLLCFVAALGAAQVSRTLHLALVPHTRCEHGQLSHAEPDVPHADQAPRRSSPSEEADVRSSHGRSSHDHCDAAAVQPATMPSAAAAPHVKVLSWQLAVMPPGPAEIRAIPLLALAPKLSPPIA